MPVLDVRDDIIISKDGRCVKLLEFAPINFELRSPSEQEQIIAAFGAALRTWPRDTHIKVITQPSDTGPFIRELKECMDSEPGEKCRRLQLDQIRMLERIGRTQGVQRRFFVSVPYESAGGFRKAPDFGEIRSALRREAALVQGTLEACGNTLVSADSRDYALSALYACACRAQAEVISWEERRAYVLRRYREAFGEEVNPERIPAADFFAPERIDSSFSPGYMVVDGKYMAHCFLPSSAYPVQAAAGWLQVLFGYMDEVYVDLWIRREPAGKIQPQLQFALKNNRIRARSADDISRDYEDLEASVSAGFYIRQALAAGDEFCYISTMLTIFADSAEELKERVREMSAYCVRRDMSLRVCLAQQDDAYLASLPCMPPDRDIFARSRRNIMASQLGSCYPFTAYELCDRGGVFLGINARYGSPVFINPFDVSRYQNANMLLFGPSGSGKTYTLLCLLLRMRQKGIPIYVIAPLKGHEFRRACEAAGGTFIRLGPGSAQNINIMEIRRRESSDSDLVDAVPDSARDSELLAKIQQLHRFFPLLIPDMDAGEKQLLDETLVKVYASFGITARNKSLADPARHGEYRPMPVLADVHRELERTGEPGRRMASLLSRFVTGSARSFSRQTSADLLSRFTVIDVSGLTEELLPAGMFIALDYVMDRVRADRTVRKVIAVDEMWKLMKASRLSAEFVAEVFKTIRGYAGAAVGATQDLEDVLDSEYGAAILHNSKIKILLPMDRREAEAVSRAIELTDEELRQLRRPEAPGTPGGERRPSKALMVAGSSHVFLRILASGTEHELITTSAEDLKRLAARTGPGRK